MSKLHSEKRIKAVANITSSSDGDPVKFEAGDIVYDLTSNSFKKKTGAVGAGSWSDAVSSGASDLGTLSDVVLTGLSDSDIGDQLTYSYIDATHNLSWGTATIKITLSRAGSRGTDGNERAIEFLSGTPAATWDVGNNKLVITYTQSNANSTAVIIAGLIDDISDIAANVVDASHNAQTSTGQADGEFAGGSEKWTAAPSGGGGGGTTNLSISNQSATSLRIESSTGNNIDLPMAGTSSYAGLMSDADKDKLDLIEAQADVTDAANVNAAGAIMHSDVGSKGQIIVGDGSGDATILTVGSNNFVLTADSNEPSGVKWAAAGGGGSSTFVTLTDTPANFTSAGSKFVKVNSSANALEFVAVTIPASIADLSDVDLTGNGDTKILAWNNSASRFEPVNQPIGGAPDAFKTITLDGSGAGTQAGDASIVADSGTDTLTLAAGANITLTGNASSDTITIAAAGGGGSSISLNDTAVTITDTGSNGNIEFKTDNTARWNITSSGHLLPNADNTFDIGSASNKVRDLYVADTSLWIGDQHKIMISGNQMKFRRRKHASGDGNVPQSLKDAIGGSSVGAFDGVGAGAITQAWIVGGNSSAFNYSGCNPTNPSDLSAFKLSHWSKVIDYVRSVDSSLLANGMASLFSAASDFATSTDSGGADWAAITNKPTFAVDLTQSGTGTVHANNYTNTTYASMGAGNSYAAGLTPAGNSTHGNEFLRKDGTWSAAGGGAVNINGSPSSNQLTLWHDGTNIKGDPNLFYNSGTRELKIQQNTDQSSVFKASPDGLSINHERSYFQFLMIQANGTAASTVATNGSPSLLTDTLNTKGFAITSPKAPTTAYGWSDKYYEFDNTVEYVQINVASAISSADTAKDFYFQLRTEEFDSSIVDDALIQFFDASNNSIQLKYTVYKENASSWTSIATSNSSSQVSFDPVIEGLSNNFVHWIKVTLEDGTSISSEDVTDLAKLRFVNHANGTPDEKLQIANFFIDGVNTDQPTETQIHKDGYIAIKTQISQDPPAPPALEGGKLYTKPDGRLHFRSSSGTFDLTTIPDSSWSGGFNQVTGTTEYYLPVAGTLESPTIQEYNQKIMLSSGQITKVIVRGPDNMGSTVCKIYKNGSALGSGITVNSASDTKGSLSALEHKAEFSFTSNNDFVVGDIISISVDPTNAFGGDCVFAVLQMVSI